MSLMCINWQKIVYLCSRTYERQAFRPQMVDNIFKDTSMSHKSAHSSHGFQWTLNLFHDITLLLPMRNEPQLYGSWHVLSRCIFKLRYSSSWWLYCSRTVTLNYEHFNMLWVPDLFFTNEKTGQFHKVTVPNRLLQVSPDGELLYSAR